VEERARRIVRTAVELAEKGGFEAVRLRDVASCSGVALGTLYRHFRSKEDLMVAALAEEVDQLGERMHSHPAEATQPVERVLFFFSTATHGICRRPMLARATLRALGSGQPELTEKVASFHGSLTALITTALRGSNGEELGSGVEAETVATVLHEVWFAALVQWAAGLHDQEAVIDHVRTAAALILER